CLVFFFQAEDGIRDFHVTGVQTCALPIFAQRKALQADWRNGAVRALEDYMAEANDVAGRTAEAIDGVLGSLQSTFEEFFRTGRRSEERRVGKEGRTRGSGDWNQGNV